MGLKNIFFAPKKYQSESRTSLLGHVTCTKLERGIDITVNGFSPRTNTTRSKSGREEIKILIAGQIFLMYLCTMVILKFDLVHIFETLVIYPVSSLQASHDHTCK